MKGKFQKGRETGRRGADPETVAIDVLGCITADPERLGAFMALTGLDPGSLRTAARTPGFLVAVLDHAAENEELLVAVAAEMDSSPEAIMRARAALSPRPSDEW